jgi:hypothetical protein
VFIKLGVTKILGILWVPKKRKVKLINLKAKIMKKQAMQLSTRKNDTKVKWTNQTTKLEQPQAKLEVKTKDMKPFPTRNHTNITNTSTSLTH